MEITVKALMDRTKTCICTVSSPGFIPGTLVLIHSFLKHNDWFRGDIVIIADGLGQHEMDMFGIFPNVVFHKPTAGLLMQIGHLCSKVSGLFPKRQRFYSIEAFSLDQYERVLFFDSDMLVTGDLSDATNLPYDLLACSDQFYQAVEKVRDRTSFKRIPRSLMTDGSKILGNTFNAGFIIIGKKFLNSGTYEGLKKLIHSNIFEAIRTHNTDQVVLNLYFDEQCHILPFEYNLVISKWPMLRDTNTVQADNIKILHFTGKYKPWEPDSGIIELAANPDFSPFFKAWDIAYEEVKRELSKLTSGR